MLRNAMIRVCSLIRAAVGASSFESLRRASPMISNWRSTADRSIASASMNSAILLAACWTSNRYFLDSSRIQQRPGALDAFSEVWVLDGTNHNEVHIALEERLQRFQEPEVSISILIELQLIELN